MKLITGSKPIRNPNIGVVAGKVAGIPGDEKPVVHLSSGLDDGVGQLDLPLPPEIDSPLSYLRGDGQNAEGQQKGPDLFLILPSGSRHDFHPSDDADGAPGIPLHFRPRLGEAAQVVSQDGGWIHPSSQMRDLGHPFIVGWSEL